VNANHAEQYAAEYTADDAYNEIEHDSEAAASGEFAGQETGCAADEYVPEESHSFFCF